MLRSNASTQTPLVHSRPPLNTDPLSALTTCSALAIAEIRRAEERLLEMFGAKKGESITKKLDDLAEKGDDDDGRKPRLLRELLPIHLLDLHMLQKGGGWVVDESDDDSSVSEDYGDVTRADASGLVDASTQQKPHSIKVAMEERRRRRLNVPTTHQRSKANLRMLVRKKKSPFEPSSYHCDDAALRSYGALKVIQIMQECERRVAEQLEHLRAIHDERVLGAAGAAREELARLAIQVRREPLQILPDFMRKVDRSAFVDAHAPTASGNLSQFAPSPIPKAPQNIFVASPEEAAMQEASLNSRRLYQQQLEQQSAGLRPSINVASENSIHRSLVDDAFTPAARQTPPPPPLPHTAQTPKSMSSVGMAWEQLAALGVPAAPLPMAEYRQLTQPLQVQGQGPRPQPYVIPRPHYTLDGQVYTPALAGGAVPPVPMMTSSRAKGYMAHLERIMASADDV